MEGTQQEEGQPQPVGATTPKKHRSLQPSRADRLLCAMARGENTSSFPGGLPWVSPQPPAPLAPASHPPPAVPPEGTPRTPHFPALAAHISLPQAGPCVRTKVCLCRWIIRFPFHFLFLLMVSLPGNFPTALHDPAALVRGKFCSLPPLDVSFGSI